MTWCMDIGYDVMRTVGCHYNSKYHAYNLLGMQAMTVFTVLVYV